MRTFSRVYDKLYELLLIFSDFPAWNPYRSRTDCASCYTRLSISLSGKQYFRVIIAANKPSSFCVLSLSWKEIGCAWQNWMESMV